MHRDILVAIDQTEESENALEAAAEIVSEFDGSVTAVYATPDEPAVESGTVEATDHVAQGEAVLAAAEERAANRGVPIDTELLVGDPVKVIADYAERTDVDVIHVGHRGIASEQGELSGESQGPLGSVAKGLDERTEIPVSVFDEKGEESNASD